MTDKRTQPVAPRDNIEKTPASPTRPTGSADDAPETPESPLESLGRAVSETVLGSQPDDAGGTRKSGD